MTKEKRIESLKKELDRMMENNDGSLQWVDDIRDLMMLIDELESE